nr:arginine deiminase-related protein [Bacillus subtilis]
MDCVFNIVSESEALIYPQAIEPDAADMLAKRYDLIEVSEDEQFTLSANVLSIGKKTIISLLTTAMSINSYRKEAITLSKLTCQKLLNQAASFRCCTMPLIRGE